MKDSEIVDRLARRAAIFSGWDGWDDDDTPTPDGNEPDEEREYWIDLTKYWIHSLCSMGFVIVPRAMNRAMYEAAQEQAEIEPIHDAVWQAVVEQGRIKIEEV